MTWRQQLFRPRSAIGNKPPIPLMNRSPGTHRREHHSTENGQPGVPRPGAA